MPTHHQENKSSNAISDATQREIALDPSRSFIVQAPAGSGKTSLLVQRYLALLATVKNPEEIIAITFTRKAAAEMQNRILDALEQAAKLTAQTSDKTILLAQKVLAKNHTEKWHLLQNPRRLCVQTIDALCGYLASRVPIASNIGGTAEIAAEENMEKYYRLAAKNLLHDTINNDGLKQQKQNSPLAHLLLHLDNDQEYFIGLCVDMLRKREQWLPHIVSFKQQYSHQQLRQILQQGLQNSIREILEKCQRNFPEKLLTEIDALLNFAIANLKAHVYSSPISQCADFYKFYTNIESTLDINILNKWRGLSAFLLTNQGSWRKSIDIRQGFPPKEIAKNKNEKLLFIEMKGRMKELLKQFEQHETFRQTLLESQTAPAATYTDAQWQILCSLLEILPLLVAQLNLIFQATGTADYTEISMAADRALGYSSAPTELALNLDYRIKHLLVDEFQDTSLAQYRLLEKLTAGWENDDGRTLFLVGDPMQSIYRFRQAEVGLFLRAQNEGIGNIMLQPLHLTANFRSHFKIIDWLNINFSRILPNYADIAVGSIPFTPCISCADLAIDNQDNILNTSRISGLAKIDPSSLEFPLGGEERATGVYGLIHDCRERRSQQRGQIRTERISQSQRILLRARKGAKQELQSVKPKCDGYIKETLEPVTVKVLVDGTPEDEAQCIVSKIKHILHHQHQTQPTQPTTIAVLLQARTHAELILTALKNAALPYRAVELESLKSSIVIQDLFSLTRALADCTDEIAWLAILRAPWCGLSLHDLFVMTNYHDSTSSSQTNFRGLAPIEMWQDICDKQNPDSHFQLSNDGIARITRFIQTITPALKNHGKTSLRNMVEDTWLRLGGPACYQNNITLEDAEKYFVLLEKHLANNFELDVDTLKHQLKNLYLSTNLENAQVQIMTIHKAKGLEFEHVIVAGLNHKTQTDAHQLLLWQERPRAHVNSSDLLFAPIKEAGEKESVIYNHLKTFEQRKSLNELNRLLYVAATRAKKSLHFFACLNQDDKDQDDKDDNEKKNKIKTPPKGSLLERLWLCFDENWLDKKYSEKISVLNNKNEEVKDGIYLSRLTSDWQSPCSLETLYTNTNKKTEPPKQQRNTNSKRKESTDFKSLLNLPNDSAAKLGTIIHQCLQKLAHDSEKNYYNFTEIEKYIASQETIWKKLLYQASFYNDIAPYIKKIASALKNMQKNPIGKWILSREHIETNNEYALTTITNDKPQHLVIDRTFIDKNNTRWIIDYKTSIPTNDMNLEEFFKQEQEKYRPQLEQYATAFRKIENRPIWLGLYFPLCNGWVKWEMV